MTPFHNLIYISEKHIHPDKKEKIEFLTTFISAS